MSHFNLDNKHKLSIILGNKLIMSVFIYESYTSMLVMYDLKKQKILWDVMCKCLLENEGCIIRCVCWSAYDRQIVT